MIAFFGGLRRGAMLAALAGVVIFSAGARADSRLLNDEEIMGLLNGATFQIQSRDSSDKRDHHFGAVRKTSEHGKLDVRTVGAREVEPGIWWVEEEQFCVLYRHVLKVRKRCFAVSRDGNDIRFIETRYELPGRHIVRPNEVVQAAQLFGPTDMVSNYHLLTDEELIALLNGKAITLTDIANPVGGRTHRFYPVSAPGEHGKMSSSNYRGKGIDYGTWWVEDEQACIFYTNVRSIRKQCFAVALAGKEYEFILTRWEQPGHVVQRPVEYVPSVQFVAFE